MFKKRAGFLFTAFVLCLSFLLNIHTASAKVQFVDVPTNYDAYEEIQYLIGLGAIKGYETKNGTYYKPHEPVLRWQAAKMVVISKGLGTLTVSKSSFKDIQAGTEVSQYVERAVKAGYFTAYNNNGEFKPYVNLSRKEMAKVLAVAFQLDADKYANLSVPFKDISKNHPYYKYIAAIYYNGITQGSPSGNNRVFMPDSSVTRGQFASFIARAKESRFRLPLPVQGVQVPNEKDAIGTVMSTTDSLNVRSSKDTSSNANRIGQINKGDKLPLFEIQSGWFKVMYKGQYAYISSSYAQVVDDSGQPLGKVQKNVIATQKVNVYKMANTSSKVIGSYNANEQIPVYKTVGNWYLTQKGGVPGYVPISSTKEQAAAKPVEEKPNPGDTPVYTTNTIGRVTTNGLNIRQNADASSKSLGTLNKGDVVAVHSISGNWANVTTAKGTKGYVHKTYLKLINQSGSPVKGRIIVIDAGHGGKDPGASDEGAVEKEITLKVATVVKNKLEAAGAKVVMTRTGDTYPTLEDRVNIALNHYAEVFVSIHVNSAASKSANGTETYYSVQGNVNVEEDATLAKAINNQIVKNADMYNRGVKQEDYYVIRNMLLPSVLVELGFITNPEDRAKLTNSEYIEIFGDSIYKGIVEYYQN
ncbi:N-acetylmuramoyl-L-alanine amidase [Ureibacillus sp. FSL W7-1570]|uniref:N-acetylmuramoyl-L-alanine amidase n=1 Tax=Ureibacillus sp. FSL W7-1570 TaxID=2954593 RepID=UPI00315A6251